jgi:DNA invertase Pin-like site-specific DNA recombinase
MVTPWSITRLDRFARSVLHLWELIQRLEAKSAGLIILDFGGNTIDTRTAAGRAMLTMFATMAQFEREVMLERQRIGIARTKARCRVGVHALLWSMESTRS